MARLFAGSRVGRNLFFIYLFFALLFLALSFPIIFSTITDTLTFWLSRLPYLAMPLLFALVPVSIARLNFVEEVPDKTLGVLVDRRQEFLALLPSGRYWISPLSQRLKLLHSLEPVPTQFSLVGLQASDGPLAPQVALVVWQIRPDAASLVNRSQYHEEIARVMLLTVQEQERLVRDELDALVKLRTPLSRLSELQTLLTERQGPTIQRLISDVNGQVQRSGLQVNSLEFLGVVAPANPSPSPKPGPTPAPSARAVEAIKQLKSARPKLNLALTQAAVGPTPRQVAQEAAQAVLVVSQARQEISQMASAMVKYYNAVTQALGPLMRQVTPTAAQQVDSARQDYFTHLNQLQAKVDEINQQLIQVAQQAGHLSVPPFGLTPEEQSALLGLLEGIAAGKIEVAPAFP